MRDVEPGDVEPEVESIVRLQRVLADALCNRDPVAFVRAQVAAGTGGAALAVIDPDGLRIAALLVSKLRFERLINGSRAAGEWFARDPRGFTAAFRDYHDAVPPTAADPWREAAAFAQWCARPGGPGPR